MFTLSPPACPPPFLKMKRSGTKFNFFIGLLAGFFLVVGVFWVQPSSAATFAAERFEESSPDPQTELVRLRIAALKLKLRLASEKKRDVSPLSSLFKLYDRNRFKGVVEEIRAFPEEERSAAIFLVYGNSLFFLGKKEGAVAAYQQAYRRAKNSGEKAAAMANFGLVLSTKGAWEQAIDWLTRALEIDRTTDNWLGQGTALSLLGDLYYQTGDRIKGAAAHIEALEIAETIPIPWLEARQLTLLANLYILDHTLDIAQKYHSKALVLYRKLDDPLGEALSLDGLSVIGKDQKRFDPALRSQSRALDIYKRLGDRLSQAKALINLALIYREQGAFQKALGRAGEALEIREVLGDTNGMAHTEGTIGTIYEKKGDLAEAVRHMESAMALFRKTGASQQIHAVELQIQRLRDQM
ncbi:MAG: tetratricopeptide repeat protein [Nitrospira sp.]|nr:tetratricopeptide repeat protein [Candidatus Manganitrophaceae bacterium]HIL35319.1 tetratricopeptide repeat protein [Candidatus Manganitrophaceae bacterium]